jgi:predicted transcriptional regulator
MGKYKENPKYNVISIRLNDKEKAFLNEMLRDTRKSVSTLMREAMNQYASFITGSSSRANIH